MDKFVKSINLNLYSMLRHGSVAVIVMFTTGIFFGTKNMMIAFPIALTSTVMGRQNFGVKTFSKAFRIILVDIAIVLVAHISSLNIYFGVIVNFIAIFFIMYVIVSPYDLTFYKPFIMLYVFTQYAKVPNSELYLRIISVIFGLMVVVLASEIKRANEKSMLGSSVLKAFMYIDEQLENISQCKYDKEIENSCSVLMSDLAYRIYITRHKGYLTTNLGKIQFKLFISIEYLNLVLLKKQIKSEEEIDALREIIKCFINYSQKQCSYYELKDLVKENIEKLQEKDIKLNILNILEGIDELNNIGSREINKIYAQWERSDIDMPKVVFKEYFRKDSIRFKFALRMAIALTFALFAGELLGYYKVIWAIITIMSIMQPYYEDTVKKAKERVIGNVLAIVITGIVINLIDNQIITTIILVISLYLLYGFKEYYKISLFSGMASICIASMTQDINVLIAYRIIYVVIGVATVYIVNKCVFPYHLKDGIEELVKKIIRINCRLINSIEKYQMESKKEHEIPDIIIHSTLLTQKLYLRNLQYNDEGIYEFININREFIINVGYRSLIDKEEGNRINIEESKQLYKIFLNKVSCL